MNPSNSIQLEGTIHGTSWSRWKSKQRGQVRFWLAVSRELAGDGFDLLLVAIEPRSTEELMRLERELRDGRMVSLHAIAHSLVDLDRPPQETFPGVIFMAEECGLDGAVAARSAHQLGAPHRRRAAHGKMAAAGDAEGDQPEFPIGGAT